MIFPTMDKVAEQGDVLDSLEASLKMVADRATQAAANGDQPVAVESPRIFDVKLSPVTSGSEMDRLRKLYRDTRLGVHTCSHLDVKRAFVVEVKSMKDAFGPAVAELANVVEAWHGSPTPHLINILRIGLIIPPRNSGMIHGRLYGDGVYGAIHSTKSLGYSFGAWDGRRTENCFMFRMEMAMGKSFSPSSREAGPYPKAGYMSTWARGGISPGVINDELIVYRTDQVNLKYLLEFSPGGK
jgi:poly [ADP-ribose] polymerase